MMFKLEDLTKHTSDKKKKKKKDLEFVKLKPIYNVYIKYSQIWEMSSIFEMSTGNSRD